MISCELYTGHLLLENNAFFSLSLCVLVLVVVVPVVMSPYDVSCFLPLFCAMFKRQEFFCFCPVHHVKQGGANALAVGDQLHSQDQLLGQTKNQTD